MKRVEFDLINLIQETLTYNCDLQIRGYLRFEISTPLEKALYQQIIPVLESELQGW